MPVLSFESWKGKTTLARVAVAIRDNQVWVGGDNDSTCCIVEENYGD
jgi:hypothetical protein